MKITFFGATRSVTGSKHLIETDDGYKMFLDCGFFQGHRKEAAELNKNFPIDPKTVNSVILSHAHLDHSGLLPLMVKLGFSGPIFATPSTCDVTECMLQDSASIQEDDADYLNRHLKKGEDPIEPIYDSFDAEKAVSLFTRFQYSFLGNRWMKINDNIRFKFYDAGHILGSAIVVIEIIEKGVKKTIAYTGDLGRRGIPILRDPEHIKEKVDVLICESTYGDRLHDPITATEGVIEKIIKSAVLKKGIVIVPAFALGRTQELIYVLHRMFKKAAALKIPIFLDSPLATKVTEVFKKHSNIFDNQTWSDFNPKTEIPFIFKYLAYTKTVQESKDLNYREGPFMIISASGMMEAGRVLHHLKNHVSDSRNTVLITGFQAQNTLGRRLQDGENQIKIFNQKYKVKADVVTVPSLSAHADQSDLLDYIQNANPSKKLFLVHGEEESINVLAGEVLKSNPKFELEIPYLGQSFIV